jgi:hypothetical protein
VRLATRIKWHWIVLSWIISLAKPLTLKLFLWFLLQLFLAFLYLERLPWPSSNFLSLLRIYKSTPDMSKPPKLRCNHLFYNNTIIPNCISSSISTPLAQHSDLHYIDLLSCWFLWPTLHLIQHCQWYQTMHRKKGKFQSKKSVSYCKDRIKLIIVIILRYDKIMEMLIPFSDSKCFWSAIAPSGWRTTILVISITAYRKHTTEVRKPFSLRPEKCTD